MRLHIRRSGSPLVQGKYPFRRGEGGGEWLGGPLWSPVGWGWAGRISPIFTYGKPAVGYHKEPRSSPLWRRTLLPQLKRPNIACHSLWSTHPSLVSRDILDTAAIRRNSVNSHTPWDQGMGLG